HGAAVALDDLCQHTAGRRRNLEDDLVGLDLDEDLVGFDGLAGLFLPVEEGGLGDRFRELGHKDFGNGHDCFPFRVFLWMWVCDRWYLIREQLLSLGENACSIRLRCCSWCLAR